MKIAPALLLAVAIHAQEGPTKPRQTLPVASEEAALGWKSLLDGKSLAGWTGDPKYWRCEAGVMVGEVTPETLLKNNTFIIWEGSASGDFELKVSCRISARGNSGINYRSGPVEGLPFALTGPQCDIDGAKRHVGQNYEERGRTFNALRGQITRVRPGAKAEVVGSVGDPAELAGTVKDGDWNEYHVVVRGGTQVHLVNGRVMSMVIDDDVAARRPEGRIGVQVHVGPPMKVEFKDFRLRLLP